MCVMECVQTGPDLFCIGITGDETLIFEYDLETKSASSASESLWHYHIYQPLCSGRIWHKVNF